MTPAEEPGQGEWPEALATVTRCVYDVRAGRALAFGLPSKRHFRISYNYWAGDALHEGEFFAAEPLPQGSFFPVRYHPETPHQNSGIGGRPAPRRVMLAIGFIGSVVLSAGWFLLLRGCSGTAMFHR